MRATTTQGNAGRASRSQRNSDRYCDDSPPANTISGPLLTGMNRHREGAPELNWLRVWLFVVATALALTFSIIGGRAILQRRKKREKLLMRDHLSRISRTWE
jgi:hypothetical protein